MKHKGFVLTELLIVVAIITILVSAAIPAYTDYIQRSKVSEGLLLALPIRAAISDFYAQHGRLPADNNEAGVLPVQQLQGQYVAGIEVKNGEIAIQFRDQQDIDRPALNNRVLTLKPKTQQTYPFGSIFWQCGGDEDSNIASQYLPSSCK